MGKSFSTYDQIHKKWIQRWVDNTGGITEFDAVIVGDTMSFITAPYINAENKLQMNRMIIIKKSKDMLYQKGTPVLITASPGI